MTVLRQLQAWYSAQADGLWEHSYGVQIESLDNPGWKVTIDLAESPLSNKHFAPMEQAQSERAWTHCKVESGQFVGVGGPEMLEQIIGVFTEWASEGA